MFNYLKAKRLLPLVLLLLLLLLHDLNSNVGAKRAERHICGSLNITSAADLEKARDCRVVAGYVRVAFADMAAMTAMTTLATNIEEIADYLLVYHVHNLRTLDALFPQLRVIRGHERYRHRYALLIYENLDLEALGLAKLQRILNGDVHIMHNPELCYVETIDWLQLFAAPKQQQIRNVGNKWASMCPICVIGVGAQAHCWAAQQPQLNASNCFERDKHGNCTACLNYLEAGVCVDKCSEERSIMLHERSCIATSDCLDLGMYVQNMKCVLTCKHQPYCVFCEQPFVIRNMGDVRELADCAYSVKSLELELGDNDDPALLSALYAAMSHIFFITDYLVVRNSKQLINLVSFGSLYSIGDGRSNRRLYKDRYVLFIAENAHLEGLFLHRVSLGAGEIYIHLNPRLCYNEILQGLMYVPSAHEVSPMSNGADVNCDPVMRVALKALNTTNTTISVAINAKDLSKLSAVSRFVYSFREAPQRNVTYFTDSDEFDSADATALTIIDIMHGCGLDNWHREISANREHTIENLKPNMTYAIYIRSVAVPDDPRSTNVASPVLYASTQPTRIRPVRSVIIGSRNSSAIEVLWLPPLYDDVSAYIVSYEQYAHKAGPLAAEIVAEFQAFNTPDCVEHCVFRDAHKSGPLPPFEAVPEDADVRYYDSQLQELLPQLSLRAAALPTDNATQSAAMLAEDIEQSPDALELDLLQQEALQNEPQPQPMSCHLERPYASVHVPGDLRSYVFNNLTPNTGYVFTVRACAEDPKFGASMLSYATARTYHAKQRKRN